MREPFLTSPARVRRAYDLLAPVYGALLELSFPHYGRAVREVFRREICALAPSCVLEVGPGTGFATRGILEGAPGTPVVAVDLSARMLRRARRRLGAGNPAWLVGDVCRGLPLRSAVADVVVCQYAAGHISDPLEAFRELFRVLRSGGTLLLGGKEASGWGRVGRWINGTRGLDRNATCEQLVAAGFRDATFAELSPTQTRFRSRFLLFRAQV